MSSFKQKIITLFKSKNFIRATVIYLGSLLIGATGLAIGLWVLDGDAGDRIGLYILNCVTGFGTGIALALLNNGHKKPVTWKSVLSTVGMTVILTVIMSFFGAFWAAIAGWGVSMIGSAVGLWFCRWESKKSASYVGIASDLRAADSSNPASPNSSQ